MLLFKMASLRGKRSDEAIFPSIKLLFGSQNERLLHLQFKSYASVSHYIARIDARQG